MTWHTSWQRKHSMHLWNSCTRSTSSWYIRRLPSGAFGFGLNGGTVVAFLGSEETLVPRALKGGNARHDGLGVPPPIPNRLAPRLRLESAPPVPYRGARPRF